MTFLFQKVKIDFYWVVKWAIWWKIEDVNAQRKKVLHKERMTMDHCIIHDPD
jgi:hypothetical protein